MSKDAKKGKHTIHALPAALLESPSFQLERIRRRTRDEVEAVLAKHHTSLREYWVLTCLADSQASSQSALGDLLVIDASDMVRLIDGLQAHGWVQRDRDPKDRRRQIVTCTKKGEKAQKELAALVQKGEDRALDESTSKQLKHLRRLAKAIIADETDD
ncbi:transcriptional regulator [Corynebacterium renale]|uniref:DNA-binding MarR family transcriptional regulator n=1 Tax=Corynebacterium renale TaxID=1724 RepID=A0A2A9DN04_9CORY|nr:MarR family transcriptional regulator [Corynebacterium renale]PFG27983.1 DNA-binding MarR family transcriptional regulator [Corynebacterium renale]SQG63294.1 transcriptional regulator [Corynebacterium renale]SQI21493.1 transcriptional regulator [Corynebacterium renale]STC99387.1 transcriptional regulator [Corynebacterium renale]